MRGWGVGRRSTVDVQQAFPEKEPPERINLVLYGSQPPYALDVIVRHERDDHGRLEIARGLNVWDDIELVVTRSVV